jgi:hypothetical protein
LLGASLGVGLIFVYAFSSPILERMGHVAGWPGNSLRLWEKFTGPVFSLRGRWFWSIYNTWDEWCAMLWARPSAVVTRASVMNLTLLVALLFAWVRLRNRKSGDNR